MIESWGSRLATTGALLVVLFVLLIGFGMLTPTPSLGAYPGEEELATDYESYLDERVQVAGTVVKTNPVVIATEYDYYTDGRRHSGVLELTIRAVDEPITIGQSLQVYGTAKPDQTIVAKNTVAVPATNYRYMYTVSALSGLWVLIRVLRGWRIDWQQGALVRRENPLTIGTLTDRLTEGTD